MFFLVSNSSKVKYGIENNAAKEGIEVWIKKDSETSAPKEAYIKK